jgi:hypothetical protein
MQEIDVVMPHARAGYKDTPERKQAIINYVRMGATRRDAAGAAGISYETFRVWMKEDSAFSVSVSEAECECGALMAARIYAEAMRANGDAKYALEWLKRRRRAEWGDRIDITKLTNEQIIALLEEDGDSGQREETE